jgi:hypothetical protein
MREAHISVYGNYLVLEIGRKSIDVVDVGEGGKDLGVSHTGRR